MKKKVLLIGSNSLAGRSIAASLEDGYQIVPAAGHHNPENGYRLRAEEPDKLAGILACENPEIVVSSIRGDYQAQMRFHKELADWLRVKKKRLLYLSTANVFDGSLSRPWTENDPPVPKSDYGCFKRDCETMLEQLLGNQLAIFRLAPVWSADCPRVQRLELYSRSGEPYHTYPNYTINVTFAKQIGKYAKYVLDHSLHGIFHVGTTDTVNYFSFEKLVCKALKIKPPQFVTDTADGEACFAILSARKEAPDYLQMTVADVLSALKCE
ncbi:MAG: sugar nucleotide-binding protein [Oscillospiraceae bacterium]|nr:sugar nucleotide-binding protein [Oscillospiraceae bacterium]